MDDLDWDAPAIQERWCAERREQVSEYLAKEGVKHGEVGEWPAWHIAPYVSLWAIESLTAPGHVGWWAISGDLPTDYLSALTAKYPRKALQEFADTWKEVAASMSKGDPHPDVTISSIAITKHPKDKSELAKLLERRSEALRRFAEDDSVWGAEYD